jgi:hypothetical protein
LKSRVLRGRKRNRNTVPSGNPKLEKSDRLEPPEPWRGRPTEAIQSNAEVGPGRTLN